MQKKQLNLNLHTLSDSQIEELVLERFLRYVQIETTSDPTSPTFPSTQTQMGFMKMLQTEIQQYDVPTHLSETAHLYAYLSENPTLSFFAHVDTSADAPGKGVKPIIHVVDGNDIHLPLDGTVIKANEIKKYINQKIVTSSGDTLLGADDKCAVAILMTVIELLHKQDIPVTMVFTPDEEIGRSITKLEVDKVRANNGYSLDGNEMGSYSTENFNAVNVTISFNGWYSSLAVMRFLELKPVEHPSTTSQKEGFVLCTKSSAKMYNGFVKLIVRAFDEQELNGYLASLKENAIKVEKEVGCEIKMVEQRMYYGIQTFLKDNELENKLIKAMVKADVKPKKIPFRGGFDSCWLCEKGINSINFFSGGINFHSKREFAVVKSMVKAVRIVLNLIQEQE
ncbi:Peptidase T [Entamoeba marina]